MNASTIAKGAAIAADPVGAGIAGAAGLATSGVSNAVTGAVTGALSSAISPLVSGFARVGLYIVFTLAGLGLVVLDISRLTKGPRDAIGGAVKSVQSAAQSAALVAA